MSELVVIGMNPKEKPTAMKAFSEKFVRQWQSCDARDDMQVAKLALLAFQKVISIQPYANCNKRLTTWLVQLVTRSLDRPCYLMRDPVEQQNSKSNYHDALAIINSDPKPFLSHVVERMKLAETQGHYKDELAYDICMLRYEVYSQLLEYQKS